MFGELAIAKIALFFVAVVTIVSLPLAVISVQQNQDLRQQAAVAPPPSPTLVTCHKGTPCVQQQFSGTCGSGWTIGSCPAGGCGGECSCNCKTVSSPVGQNGTCGAGQTRIGIKQCDGDGNGSYTNCEDYCSSAPPPPSPSPTTTPPTSPNPSPSADPIVGPCCILQSGELIYATTCRTSQRQAVPGSNPISYIPGGPSACVASDRSPTNLTFATVAQCGSTAGFCDDPDGCNCPVFCANRTIIRNQYCGVPTTSAVTCYNKTAGCAQINLPGCDNVTYFSILASCQSSSGFVTCYSKALNCAQSSQPRCDETFFFSTQGSCQNSICPAGSKYNASTTPNVCVCDVGYGERQGNPYFNPATQPTLPELCTPAICSLSSGRPEGCSCTFQNQCVSGYCNPGTAKCSLSNSLPLCTSTAAKISTCIPLSSGTLSGGIQCRGADLATPNSCCTADAARVGNKCEIGYSCAKLTTSTECNAINDSLDCTWKTKAANPGLPIDICVDSTLQTPASGYEACCVNGVDSNVTAGKCTVAPLYGVLGRCATQPIRQLTSCSNDGCFKGQSCQCPNGCNRDRNDIIINPNITVTCNGPKQVQCCINGTTQMVDPGLCSGSGKTLGVCITKVNLTSCIAACTSGTCTCPAGCKKYTVSATDPIDKTCGGNNVSTCCVNGVTKTDATPAQCAAVNSYVGACGSCYALSSDCTVVSRSSCDNVNFFSDKIACTDLVSIKQYQDGPPCSIATPTCTDPEKVCAITTTGQYRCLNKSAETIPVADINSFECTKANLGSSCLTSQAASEGAGEGPLIDDGVCTDIASNMVCVKKGIVLRAEIKPGDICTRTEACYCVINFVSYGIEYLKKCPDIGFSTCSADGTVTNNQDQCCKKVLHFDNFLKENVCGPLVSLDNPLVNGNSCNKDSGGCTCQYNQCQCRVGDLTSTILGGQLCYNKSRDSFKPDEICGENYCKGTCEVRQLQGKNYAVCNFDGVLSRDYYLIQPGEICPTTSKGCYCRNQLVAEGQTCRASGTELSLVETCKKYCRGDDWCAQDGITITCRPGRFDSYTTYTMNPNKAGDVCDSPASCQANSCLPAQQTIGNKSGKCGIDNLNYCCKPNEGFTSCSAYFSEDPNECNSHPECEYTNLGGKVDCYNKAVSQPEKVLPPAETCTSICNNSLGCSCVSCAKASTAAGFTCGGAALDITEGFKAYIERWNATFNAIQQGSISFEDAIRVVSFQILDTVSLGQAGWGYEARQTYDKCAQEVADGTRDAEANCISEAADVAYRSIQIAATAIEVTRSVTSFVDDVYNTFVRQPYLRSQVATELVEGQIFIDETGESYRVGKNGTYTAVDATEIQTNNITYIASEPDGLPCLLSQTSLTNQKIAVHDYSSVLGVTDSISDKPLADLNPCKTRRYRVSNPNDTNGVGKEIGGKRVGGGAFASVYTDPSDPNIVIKVFRNSESEIQNGVTHLANEELLAQIEALKNANGTGGLPKIRGYVFDSSGQVVGYAMEKINGVTIKQAQGFFSGVKLNKEQVRAALQQVKEAQEVLGGPHGDLNLGNVIIRPDKTIGLIDPLGIFARDGSGYSIQKAADEINNLQIELIKICSDCGQVSPNYYQ